MAKSYDVKFVLLCDDVRQEVNKKAILIGYYPNNEIVVPSLPTNVAVQTFMIMLVPHKKHYSNVTFKVRDPRGQQLLDLNGEATFEDIDKLTSVVFQRSPAAYLAEGKHDLIFGMGDEKPRKIGEFTIINSGAKKQP